MRKTNIVIFSLLFIALSSIFVDALGYTFAYREQEHLFLFDTQFFSSLVASVGGVGEYASLFVTQFFYVPYLGEVILALILSFIYLLSSAASYRLFKAYDPLFLALIPVVYLLTSYESLSFNISHVTSFFTVLLSIYILTFIKNRVVFVVVLSLVMALYCYAFGWIYVCAAATVIFLTTLSAYLFKSVVFIHKKWFIGVVLLLYTLFASVAFVQSYNAKEKLMALTELALQKGDWDSVLAYASKSRLNSSLMHYYQNMALAYSGRLSTSLFNHRQAVGSKSLYVTYDTNSSQFTKVGHYVYEYIGHIHEATHWANESIVVYGESSYNLINLIKYNILLGKPKVAMRYIRRLDKSLFYKNIALYYKNMIDRGDMPNIYLHKENNSDVRFTNTQSFRGELDAMIALNPLNKNALTYKFAFLLLEKKFSEFVSELIAATNSGIIVESDITDQYLQALLVYGQVTGASTPLDHLITDELKGRYIGYIRAKSDKNWAELKSRYKSSYWLYLDYSDLL